MGEDVKIIGVNEKQEVEIAIPPHLLPKVGDIIVFSKHPDYKIDEAMLGEWIVKSNEGGGNLRLSRFKR